METGSPVPPPLPNQMTTITNRMGLLSRSKAYRKFTVSTDTQCLMDQLFDEGYRADVTIYTDSGDIVYAHSSILGIASPVLRTMIKESRRKNKRRSISIRGVPFEAVRVFIRFLYSSRYEKEEMKEHVLNLLVLSHVYVVPQLKKVCEFQFEKGLLNVENVIDIFQMALLCDAPRLSLMCYRLIIARFEETCASDGWEVMKTSHPILERELLESIIDSDARKKEIRRKTDERKIYLQLYEAMEALVHICRDGCQTIGPHDKVFTKDQTPCNYHACKGLESLVRHFARCKARVPGGCIHCKRMWQLLELHSRICANSDVCRVPLCWNFKQKRRQKKDDMKWRILVKKILRTKSISGAPFFSLA